MSNLAIQYYIKAKDNYPFNLEEVVESLNYALSYDADYAAAHCLMAQMLVEEVSDYEHAFHHFEQALIADVNYIETYYHYSLALIFYDDVAKAQRLLDFAKTIKGVNLARIHKLEGILLEKSGRLVEAKHAFKKAIFQSVNNEELSDLKEDLARIKNKLPKKKKKKKSKMRKKTA